MKGTTSCLRRVCCLVLLVFLVAPLSALAQTPYYKGKTISFIVPAVPGGGTDIAARWIAPWLTKYVPGNPVVNVINMPGASGMIGPNHVYNLAKKDGCAMLVGSGAQSLLSLLQLKGVEYDIAKMPVVLASAQQYVYYIKGDLIKDFKDIFDKELVIFGHQPAGTGTTTKFLLMKELLGFKTQKLILAYQSSGDAWRAYVAGEINTAGITNSGYEASVKPLVKKGEVKVLFQTGVLDGAGNVVRAFPLEDVPTIYERYVEVHGKPPAGKIWDSLKAIMGATVMFNNMFSFAPGVPNEYVNIVADASEKIAKDPKFIADSNAKLKIKFAAGEPLRKVFEKNIVNVDPEAMKWVRSWIREKYKVE